MKLPEWFTNMSTSTQIIVKLITGIIFILGLASQAFSFGLDFKIKMQQIDKNTKGIQYEKCLRIKKGYQDDLNYHSRRYSQIHTEYITKKKAMPKLILEEWNGLPIKISNLTTKKDSMKCE